MTGDNDILRGEPRIRAYLNTLLSEPINDKHVYRWIAAGELRAGKVMGRLTATKTSIREDLSRLLGVPVGGPGQ